MRCNANGFDIVQCYNLDCSEFAWCTCTSARQLSSIRVHMLSVCAVEQLMLIATNIGECLRVSLTATALSTNSCCWLLLACSWICIACKCYSQALIDPSMQLNCKCYLQESCIYSMHAADIYALQVLSHAIAPSMQLQLLLYHAATCALHVLIASTCWLHRKCYSGFICRWY